MVMGGKHLVVVSSLVILMGLWAAIRAALDVATGEDTSNIEFTFRPFLVVWLVLDETDVVIGDKHCT